ncbi:hypothetical protein GGP53_002824 [Salinibacter ruber]|uniref:hypothetical protein n=1 Tax=Salinibacter ruber TaxID=146919 RepID=UPI002167166C|nr:hypothetical protein [Salinibacter ruber]MCS3628945.1 hypothetical protein [Salinibacter ruber]MCS4145854.1 hypothetical protein [Salinibacter ruber]
MKKRSIYIHIGPGKTGTTFLQKRVIPKIQSVGCVVKPEVVIGNGISIKFRDLFDLSPKVWKIWGDRIFGGLGGNKKNGNGADLLISDEGASGAVLSPRPRFTSSDLSYGSPSSRRHYDYRGPLPSTFGGHLEAMSEAASEYGFGDIKILATTRRQDTRLASTYAQISDRIRGASQKNFEEWVRYLTKNPQGYYDVGGGVELDYFQWWKEAVRVVGQSNVLFQAFELLRESNPNFLRTWLRFLEVSEVDSIINSLQQA